MKALSLAGAAVVLLTASPAALAQVDPSGDWRATSRLVAAVSMAAAHGDQPATTTQGGGLRNVPLNVGLAFGGEHRVFDRLWLGGSWSLAQWMDGAGVDAGYVHRRFELGVAPRLEVYRRSGRIMAMSFDLALPIGLSLPYVAEPRRRAFSEQVDSQLGWYGGATASMTMLFRLGRRPANPRLGFRVEAGYVRHASHRRTTFTPTDVTQAPVVEERDLVDHEALLAVAGVLGF